jgi:hypothetical protein
MDFATIKVLLFSAWSAAEAIFLDLFRNHPFTLLVLAAVAIVIVIRSNTNPKGAPK